MIGAAVARLVDALPGLAVLGVVFILGTWYGLYLNVTHMHRMRRWACRVADLQMDIKERANS